ncbi:MAG: hypothetical protein JXN65_03540 [Clostridia bacterium]|nr:hypothetical protein [Clostridia bacterium]
MNLSTINCYDDFVENILMAGFTLAGDNSEGIFTLAEYFSPEIRWHTGLTETDPWAWCMLSVNQRDDIMYGKFFFNKGGYITKEWYTLFYSVRRHGRTFDEKYAEGKMTRFEKDIYNIICGNPSISLDKVKEMLGIDKQNKSRFNSAVTRLQMGMFITVSGETLKISNDGMPYGWPATTFETSEYALGEKQAKEAKSNDPSECAKKIEDQILRLNPNAEAKKIQKFIYG